jgi:ABC-type antimicrobial peptide transport system, permease component
MGFAQSFKMAIKSLLLSKVRALLTMLGIIIGVGAVITILSLGNGMETLMTEQFETMGSNLVMVNIFGFGSTREAKVEDMYNIADKYPEYIGKISPEVSLNRKSVKQGNTTYNSGVSGVSEDYPFISNLTLVQGRFLNYVDISTRQNVCVIGSYLVNEMFSGDAVGKTIKINGYTYTVVGTLEAKANSGEGTDDDKVYIPYTNALKLNGSKDVVSYQVSATSNDTSSSAKAVIENMLFEIYGDDELYFVMNMVEIMDTFSDMMGVLVAVISAIAAISLLVGGIGIMNIMLVSVTERTREIGIRKSLGAKRNDIRLQFIIEAATTSAIGGSIGIVFGIVAATVAGSLLEIKAQPTLQSIIISFGFSALIGIAFGYMPANNAAKLNPIEALRHD